MVVYRYQKGKNNVACSGAMVPIISKLLYKEILCNEKVKVQSQIINYSLILYCDYITL